MNDTSSFGSWWVKLMVSSESSSESELSFQKNGKLKWSNNDGFFSLCSLSDWTEHTIRIRKKKIWICFILFQISFFTVARKRLKSGKRLITWEMNNIFRYVLFITHIWKSSNVNIVFFIQNFNFLRRCFVLFITQNCVFFSVFFDFLYSAKFTDTKKNTTLNDGNCRKW